MLASLRILVGALLSAAVVVVAAMAIPLGTVDGAFEPTPLIAVPVVLALGSALVCETVGYRHPAIAPGTAKDQAMRQATAAYSTGTLLRFALSEVVLVLTLALGFVLPTGGYLALLVAAPITMALVWFECWPRERPIARSQASLERDGGVSHLRAAYGLRTDTVIQEL